MDELKNTPKIMHELNDLKNRHRLAMHIWESRETPTAPCKQLEDILAIPAEDTLKRLQEHSMPLLSTTLLPSDMLQQSVAPYGLSPGGKSLPGYLISFDEAEAFPARAIVASGVCMESGTNYQHKQFSPRTILATPHNGNCIPPELAGAEAPEVFDKIAGAGGLTLSSYQLDALGKFLNSGQALHCDASEEKNILALNEVIGAITAPRIKAIMMPVWHKPQETPKEAAIYSAITDLRAGLTGLDELRRGRDLPVVEYNVGKPAQGEFCYVGQGKGELIAFCIDALRRLEKNNALAMTNSNSVFSLLGLNVYEPLSKQTEAIEALQHDSNRPQHFVSGGGVSKPIFYDPQIQRF